ncbi:MAG: alpha/beta fold hydrolase [Anaerolineales bacterium]|nr:alpha/beta fold hydrolase [Anaerolineales bacterium]
MKEALITPTAEPFFFPGSRTGCLLVHGFTGTPKEMRWLGEYLAQQGYSVLGVRLAAHATRPEDMIRARWRDWLASVEDGWNLLSGCCERIFVMGLSMGGMLALTFAARFPVAGVVAMATPHHMPPDPRVPFIKLISIFKPLLPKEPSHWYDPQAYEQHADYPVDPTRAYIEVRDLMGVMRAALPQVTAPALLIYSKNDQTVTAQEKHMEQIYAALGSQDKQSLWVENSSHVITEDAARLEVFQAVADFVARRVAGEA